MMHLRHVGLLALLGGLVDIASATSTSRQTSTSFSWAAIEPSRTLQYHPCYDGFRCARLQVPLDWTATNTTKNSTSTRAWVVIAIISLPASVAEDDKSFGGTIIINPGGPGVSGVTTLLSLGQTMKTMLDGKKHYELVSFDPRGTGMTTPAADCYSGDNFRRTADSLSHGAYSLLNDLGLHLRYQEAVGRGRLCAEQHAGRESIFQHMSTASVARDMLEIVDRIEESRSADAKQDKGKPLLQYWGFSYGTVLGQAFAAMFSDRVGKMVLDGVGDAEDLLTGEWKTSTKDAEKALDHFFQTCLDAGPLCRLRQEWDTNVANIRQRVTKLLSSLDESPVAAVYGGRAQLVTAHLVRDSIRNTFYAPLGQYDGLATTLAEALAGNYTRLLATQPISRDATCQAPDTAKPPSTYSWISDASIGIFCGDTAATAGNRNLSWAKRVVRYQANQSVSMGEEWARFLLSCVEWPFAPKMTFPASFTSNLPLPILIVSTRYDPATPLANAQALAHRFRGSRVVVQESVGHTALVSSRSNCTEGIIREYFESGKLPGENKTCQPDCVPGIPRTVCVESSLAM